MRTRYAIAIVRAVPWPASNGKMALYYMEITAKTWISLSKGTKLLLYRKDHAHSKLRAFHVKLIVCRPLNLAVGRLLKKKKKKKKMELFGRFPYSMLATLLWEYF